MDYKWFNYIGYFYTLRKISTLFTQQSTQKIISHMLNEKNPTINKENAERKGICRTRRALD